MQAFRADFVSSRIQRGLALGYAALLVGAVCVYFSGSLKWGLLAAITACGAWAAWRKPRYDVKRLMVDNQGFAAVFIGDEAFAAQPISGCLATRWARAQIKRRTGVELGVRKRRKGIF